MALVPSLIPTADPECDLIRIDKATALEFAPNPEQLKMAIKGVIVAAPGIL